MPRTARKYGRQYSSLFTTKKGGKGPAQVFTTPTDGQLKLINKAKQQTILFY